MRPRSLLLDSAIGAVIHTVLLFSLYLLLAGHNAPGGGFVGGLVAGAALVLRYVQGGPPAVRATAPVAPDTFLGVGLAIGLATAVAPMLAGDAFFQSYTVERVVPLVGKVKTGTALAFDVGVYLVVVGLVLATLRHLGSEEPES